jgi:hypothetical protein
MKRFIVQLKLNMELLAFSIAAVSIVMMCQIVREFFAIFIDFARND